MLILEPTQPNYSEDRELGYDRDNDAWGIFGVKSHYCYHLCYDKAEAEKLIQQFKSETKT